MTSHAAAGIHVSPSDLLRSCRYGDVLKSVPEAQRTAKPSAVALLKYAQSAANFDWGGCRQACDQLPRNAVNPTLNAWLVAPVLAHNRLDLTIVACSRVVFAACLCVRALRAEHVLAAVGYLNPLIESGLRIALAQVQVQDGEPVRDIFLDVGRPLTKNALGCDFELLHDSAARLAVNISENYVAPRNLTHWAAKAACRRNDAAGTALREWSVFNKLIDLGNGVRHTLGNLPRDRFLDMARQDFSPRPRTRWSVDDVAAALAKRVNLLLNVTGCTDFVPPPCELLDTLDCDIMRSLS